MRSRGLRLLAIVAFAVASSRFAGQGKGQEPPSPKDSGKGEHVAVSLGFSKARNEILIADAKGMVSVLDLSSGRCLQTVKCAVEAVRREVLDKEFPKRPVVIYTCPISLSGGRITVLRDGRVSEVEKGEERILKEDEALKGCKFLVRSDGGEEVLAGTDVDGLVAFGKDRKVYTRKVAGALGGPLAITPDGRTAFVPVGEAAWEVVALPTLDLMATEDRRLGYLPILCFAVSRDGSLLTVSHGVHCRVKTYALSPKGEVKGSIGAFKADSPCYALSYDGKGERLVLGHADGSIRVVNSRTSEGSRSGMSEELAKWESHRKPVRGVGFYQDDKLIVSLAEDGEVVARSFPEGKVVWKVNAFAPKEK